MVIFRNINGRLRVFSLSDDELLRAYKEQKEIMDTTPPSSRLANNNIKAANGKCTAESRKVFYG